MIANEMMRRAMRVAAFIGPSNSGKTNLICALVRHFVARGERVAAVKHTHHSLNDERTGDTGRFLDAGAEPVILAGDGDAVLFAPGGTKRLRFTDPGELLSHLDDADLVLIEGFKNYDGWPRFAVCSFEEAVAHCGSDEAGG